MTFHVRGLGAARKVKNVRARRQLERGALSINIWSTMPTLKLGTIADDWKAVGADMRRAMTAYADELG